MVSANPIWHFVSEPVNLHLPDFSTFSAPDLLESVDRAVAFLHDRLSHIVDDPSAPTFYNTTLAIGRAYYPVSRLGAVVRLLRNHNNVPALTDAIAEADEGLTAARLDMMFNSAAFERLEQVSTKELNPEDKRHHELLIAEWVSAGARLDSEDKELARSLWSEIERLETQFTHILATAQRETHVHIPTDEHLQHVPQHMVRAAALTARHQDLDGYVFTLETTTSQMLMCYIDDSDTRQKILDASMARGSYGDEYDTREIVADLAALRAVWADLLGYQNFADFQTYRSLAGNSDTVYHFLSTLKSAAHEHLITDLTEVEERYHPDTLTRADIGYWLNRLVSDKAYNDLKHISEYFEVNTVLEYGVFYSARMLYGLEFQERPDLSAWHPDVRIFEVHENSKAIGLLILDLYTREGKVGGAWVEPLVSGGRFTGEKPIATMALNLRAPLDDSPHLLDIDEVTTLFHEFGHALHVLLANSTYPSRAGTNVPRDYVEFPSQLHEMWAFHPDVLPNYAVHVRTQEPLSPELADKLRLLRRLNRRTRLLEFLAAAIVDLSWHTLEPGEQVDAVLTFETEVLESAGFDKRIVPRYRSPYFWHVFSGAYAACYYSYLYADIFARAAEEWFENHGGLDPEAGATFRETILAPGFSIEPKQALKTFFGTIPSMEALMNSIFTGSTEHNSD